MNNISPPKQPLLFCTTLLVEKIAMGLTVGRSMLGGLAGMAAGTLAGIAMTDLYADLDKSTLILLEPLSAGASSSSSSSTEKVDKPSIAIATAVEKTGERVELPIPPVSPPSTPSPPPPLGGGVAIPFVGNAGTALSMLVGAGGVEGW